MWVDGVVKVLKLEGYTVCRKKFRKHIMVCMILKQKQKIGFYTSSNKINLENYVLKCFNLKTPAIQEISFEESS